MDLIYYSRSVLYNKKKTPTLFKAKILQTLVLIWLKMVLSYL